MDFGVMELGKSVVRDSDSVQIKVVAYGSLHILFKKITDICKSKCSS